MDWLIKMELARANAVRAALELKGVDGLEYLVDELLTTASKLALEIAEYKEHAELDS